MGAEWSDRDRLEAVTREGTRTRLRLRCQECGARRVVDVNEEPDPECEDCGGSDMDLEG